MTPEKCEQELDQKITLAVQRMQRAQRTLDRLNHRPDRKERAHRLIQIGAELEAWTDMDIDPQLLAAALEMVVNRKTGGRLGQLIAVCYAKVNNQI